AGGSPWLYRAQRARDHRGRTACGQSPGGRCGSKRRNQVGCQTSEETSRIMSEVVRLGTVGVTTDGVSPRKTFKREETKYKINGIGVVGLGYWGPNWVRNLHQLRQARRVVACDLDAKRRDHVRGLYAGVEGCSNLDDLLEDREIEGLVIATPV